MLTNHPNVLGGAQGTAPAGSSPVGTTGIAAGEVAYGASANIIKGEAAFAYNDTTNTLTVGAIDLTTALTAADGGTGQSSYTVGDLLYASGATALSKLAASTSGYVLTAQGAGVAPIWAPVAGAGLGDFSGPASSTDNEIVRFDGTSGKTGQTSGLTIGDVASTNITISPIAANNLTLAGGSSGATLTLGQGTSGAALLGLSTALTASSGIIPAMQIVIGGSSTSAGTTLLQRAVNDAAGCGFYFTKTRTATPGSYTSAVQQNDTIMALISEGADGVSALRRAATINVVADELFSATSSPGRIVFSTTASGATSVTERLRLTSTGNLLLGGTTDISGSGNLKVFGTTDATSTTTGAFQCAGGGSFEKAVYIGGIARLAASTATPAGGSTSALARLGTTAGFGIYYGSGAPTVSAAQGSIYLRSDGSGTSNRFYVNTDGATTWTPVITTT